MIGMGRIILVTIVCCLFIWHGLLLSGVSAKNTLAPGESLSPFDDEYLESSNKVFMLKFMKLPGSSSALRCFLSIQWAGYLVTSTSKERTIWVAWLGESETYDLELIMEREGRLLINDVDNEFVINDPQQHPYVMNTTATLLDTGNLVLQGGGRTLWQSFDHPRGNIWIPGMKLGWFGLQKTPQLQKRCLTSWTSEENPSPGAFRLCVDPNNTKQLVAMRRGVVYWHSGVWNGYNFPFLQVHSHRLRYFSNHNESYFAWDGNFDAGEAFIKIYATGTIFAFVEDLEDRNYTISRINCDRNDTYYSNVGCLKSPKQSNCSAGDKFNLTTGFIESNIWEQILFNTTLNIGDCKEMCVQNCSCNAYATLETDGTGCKFSSSTEYQYTVQGDTLYIRYGKRAANQIHAPPPPAAALTRNMSHHMMRTTTIIALTVILPVTALALIFLVCYSRKSCTCCFIAVSVYTAPIVQSTQQLAGQDEDLPFFDFKCIEMATNYFSEENKLGQGGFGPVYKAWGLWIEGKVSDLIDPTMDKVISIIEATRYIQVGLLCVQDSATDRPTMTDVVSMLGNESTILPIPKQPGFSAIIGLKCGDVANNSKSCSINEVTITEIEGR
nr:G-type lectin S-receptor-like serine/threonine-protein kinase At1g67520 [Ipomoea batatas]